MRMCMYLHVVYKRQWTEKQRHRERTVTPITHINELQSQGCLSFRFGDNTT